MLNPELIKEFGEESIRFFTSLKEYIGEAMIDLCYALRNDKIQSGDLCGPSWIYVYTTDGSVYRKIENECIHVSHNLMDEDEERDIAVLCLPYDKNEEEECIKVWV